MSYCVNCGVELTEGTLKCPLCSTVVINPNVIESKAAAPLYPNESAQLKMDMKENTRLTALIVSVILALPAVVCMVCDYGINRHVGWSLFVILTCALLWCFIIPPILLEHAQPLTFIILDTIFVAVFLYILYCILQNYSQQSNWFTSIALPITICAGVYIGIISTAFRANHLNNFKKLAIALFATAALLVAVEITTDLFLYNGVDFSWSLIAMTPCAIIGLLLLIIDRKHHLRKSIEKRTFV